MYFGSCIFERMKSPVQVILLTVLSLLFFGQCTIERRLYNKGFHIEKRGRFRSEQEADKPSKTEEPKVTTSEKESRKSDHTVSDTLANTVIQAENNSIFQDEVISGTEVAPPPHKINEKAASSAGRSSKTETSSPQYRKTDKSSDDVKNVLAIIFGTLAFFSLLGLILLLVILKNLGTIVLGESVLLILGIVFFAALTIIFLVVFLGLLLR